MGSHAGVIAQNKVVPLGVSGLVQRNGSGEVEDAPVCDVADYAALAEDGLAGGEDESVCGVKVSVC